MRARRTSDLAVCRRDMAVTCQPTRLCRVGWHVTAMSSRQTARSDVLQAGIGFYCISNTSQIKKQMFSSENKSNEWRSRSNCRVVPYQHPQKSSSKSLTKFPIDVNTKFANEPELSVTELHGSHKHCFQNVCIKIFTWVPPPPPPSPLPLTSNSREKMQSVQQLPIRLNKNYLWLGWPDRPYSKGTDPTTFFLDPYKIMLLSGLKTPKKIN